MQEQPTRAHCRDVAFQEGASSNPPELWVSYCKMLNNSGPGEKAQVNAVVRLGTASGPTTLHQTRRCSQLARGATQGFNSGSCMAGFIPVSEVPSTKDSSKRHPVPCPVPASATRMRCVSYKHLGLISSGRNVLNCGLRNDSPLAISSPGRSGSTSQDLIISQIKYKVNHGNERR